MRRIELYGSCLIKAFTMPLRALIGLYNSVEKNMPDTLEMPYEIKKKKGGSNVGTKDETSSERQS